MTSAPSHARVVIIGAGIVGNSVSYHLHRQGWRDLVLLDKGPFPNPGGSTGHASNFCYPIDYSRLMVQITRDSVRQYKELGVFRESGGLELARSEENARELLRRASAAKSWDVEADLLTPVQVKQMMPFVNTDIIRGGLSFPRTGVVDSLRAGTIMRERAQEAGALSIFPNTEVLGVTIRNGRIHSVRTSRGEIRTEYLVIACGVWSPRIARMAGASIPLTPVVHQMISVGPIEEFAKTGGEIGYPILRDMTALMYERQNGSDMEVGSYAHRPILMAPDDIPSIEESKLSPTELPFTKEDFEPQMAHALELLPELLGDERAGIQYAINGLLSLTPDGAPLVGETPEVKGLWSAAAVWVKEGPGVGRIVGEWMTQGDTEYDTSEIDIARFYPYGRTKSHVISRTSEGYNRTYGIVHPREQWSSSRNIRLSPFHGREVEAGAVFFETAGWERPQWYRSNEKLLSEYGSRIQMRPNEWDSRWWSPIISAEHLAMRDRVGMVDLSAFAIFDITGPGALDCTQRLAVFQMDVPVGKAVYTPLLTHAGKMKSDVTITRTAEDSFRIVTGGAQGGIDGKWFRDCLPADGSVQLHDMTASLCTLGLWGPSARAVMQAISADDMSDTGLPFSHAKQIWIGPVPVWALRISYVGEMGWELYASMEQGRLLWDMVWKAGQEHGIVPVGIGVYGTSARIEKSYRLYGNELDMEYNAYESGLTRRSVKKQDFIGKQAYLKQASEELAASLCTLTVDDHTSHTGEPRFMLGREPVLTLDGKPIEDRLGRRSFVTSAGTAPSLGKHLLMTYLPPELAVAGTKLKVEYFSEHYPVTVAVVGPAPLFDPSNERMKG
ncbi:MAG: FAD-dependent oxidoreductase [Acidobacteria bacterium]|nr:FAD-dependent oxidoreductase [Acidobacteriota bacterium]